MDKEEDKTKRYRKGKIDYDISPLSQELFMWRTHLNDADDDEKEDEARRMRRMTTKRMTTKRRRMMRKKYRKGNCMYDMKPLSPFHWKAGY